MDLNIVDNKKHDAAILPRVSIRLNNFYFLFNYTEKWDGLFIWTFCRIKIVLWWCPVIVFWQVEWQDTKYDLIKGKLDCSIKTSGSVIDSNVQWD